MQTFRWPQKEGHLLEILSGFDQDRRVAMAGVVVDTEVMNILRGRVG